MLWTEKSRSTPPPSLFFQQTVEALPSNLVLTAPALSSPRLQESWLPVPRTDLQPLTLPSEPPDLTPEERMELENIRRRKQELLVEIQRLREELSEAMSEVEGLEANEGR